MELLFVLLAVIATIFMVLLFRSELYARFIYRNLKEETVVPIPHTNPNFVPAVDLPRKVKYDALQRISPQYTREHIGEPKTRWYQNDYILAQRMTQKIRDLQDQLIRHKQAVDGFQLEPKDVVRYEAMVEILKAMMQQ